MNTEREGAPESATNSGAPRAAASPRAAPAPAPQRRVLFVLNSFVHGGVEEHAAMLARELPAFGYEATVALAAEKEGLRTLIARLDAAGTAHVDLDSSRTGPLAQGAAALRLVRRIRGLRADLVHVHLTGFGGGRVAFLGSALAGVPAVVTHHLAPSARLGFLPRLMRAPFLGTVRAFIAVSDANRRAQVELMGLPPRRTVRIHNGVCAPHLAGEGVAALGRLRTAARARLLAELGIGADAALVGAVGRLASQKGLDWLIEAAPAIVSRAPGAHFVLVGDGPERRALADQALRLGVAPRFHWLGFRSDGQRLLAGFDVLAMPSRFEGLPLVLLEAMAAGLPTVACAVDGIPEAIRDGEDGLLVAPGDVTGLADGIARLLLDPALAGRLGESARHRFLEAFTAEAMARHTAALYDRILAGGEAA